VNVVLLEVLLNKEEIHSFMHHPLSQWSQADIRNISSIVVVVVEDRQMIQQSITVERHKPNACRLSSTHKERMALRSQKDSI
jgi:hypothetical protein